MKGVGVCLALVAVCVGAGLVQAGDFTFPLPVDRADSPGPANRTAGPQSLRITDTGSTVSASGAPDWRRAMGSSSPPYRGGHAMTYDSARGRVVLFGGLGNEVPRVDTWEWDGNTWVERTPATSPPARWGHAMAYDSARGRVVLFGGYAPYLSDTWEWDGKTWVQRSPAASPSARYGHSMAYDSARGRVVLFGGETGLGQFASDTWEWDGNTWVERTPATRPSPRSGHRMAYDSARGRVVLFGGFYPDGASHYLADTWEWDGNAWVERTPASSPTARAGFAMVYDSACGRVMLFGRNGDLADTWEWDGITWVQRTPATSAPVRGEHAMAYDSARGRVVLFGGSWDGFLADTWEWDGNTWVERTPATSPPFRYVHAMAYDSARERVVLFGGRGNNGYFADTWEWDGIAWLGRTPAASPSERFGHAMAYDSARGRVVLFGGDNNRVTFDETWEWDGTTWVEARPTASPSARYGHAMAYDSARGRVVLFGGETSPGRQLADTWEWDGVTWVQKILASSPPACSYHAMAYDSARGRVVLFGGETNPGIRHHETWEWDGNAWVEKTSSTSPMARLWHAIAYDGARGRVVLFGGLGDQGERLADTWEWDGVTWDQRTTASSPPARFYHAMAYDGARGRLVLFGGLDKDEEIIGDTWEYGPANQPPMADAGPDQVLECSGDGMATAALDGSGSSDPDSTPGTQDDLSSFAWSESGTALASGETASVPFHLGEHDVLLTVMDKAGATAADGVVITVADTTPPTMSCAPSVTVECQSASQSQITIPPAAAADRCDGAATITNDRTQGGADASGSYPLGSTTVTFTATDGAGNSATCQTVVNVVDTTPPVVTVEAAPNYLWPPNHKMYPVHGRIAVFDACDPSPRVVLQSAVSSEPDDAPGGGDGNTANDVQGATLGAADFDVLLRAERDGSGPGRTYTLEYRVWDASGNTAIGRGRVVVPNDQGGIPREPASKRNGSTGARGGQSRVDARATE
jgi:hypothetical protein